MPWNKPIMESEPGSPFNYNVMGASLGLFLASKNQKNVWEFSLLIVNGNSAVQIFD